jgi:hypothetical protein
MSQDPLNERWESEPAIHFSSLQKHLTFADVSAVFLLSIAPHFRERPVFVIVSLTPNAEHFAVSSPRIGVLRVDLPKK